MKRLARWISFACVVVMLAAFAAWKHAHRAKPPFELSIWYWHSPFRISPTEANELKEIGIRQIFVRAGTFSSDGKNIVLVIPQRYGTGARDFKIQLVFNFDAGVVHHFQSYDLNRLAQQIAVRVEAQQKIAQKAGLDITGVQFDFDCPTRLLPRYAQLIQRVRPQLKTIPKEQFSTTALLSWLGTRGVQDLARQIDFLVPQAYEGKTGRTVDTMLPVSDEQEFRRLVGRADSLPCPFYIGIPAYGHGFMFDETGALKNIYRGYEPGDLFHHPSFAFISAYPSNNEGQPAKTPQDSVGEEILKFKATRPGLDGQGLGYTVGYTTPTPDLARRMLNAARETQSPNCLGAILYRMPEGDSEETIPLPSLVAAIEGKDRPPKLKVGLDAVSDSFDVIESPKPLHDAPKDLDLTIENIGGPSFLSLDAVELEVHLSTPGIDDINSRDMTVVTVGQGTPDGIRECPPGQADTVLFAISHVVVGQKLSVGPIRLLSSKKQNVSVKWKARCTDGFRTEGGEIELAE